jgi:putative DNA primase/helicase
MTSPQPSTNGHHAGERALVAEALRDLESRCADGEPLPTEAALLNEARSANAGLAHPLDDAKLHELVDAQLDGRIRVESAGWQWRKRQWQMPVSVMRRVRAGSGTDAYDLSTVRTAWVTQNTSNRNAGLGLLLNEYRRPDAARSHVVSAISLAVSKPQPEDAPRARAVEGGEASDLTTEQGQTDTANARRFVAAHGDAVRYCDPWSKWLAWDGRRWAIDDRRRVELLAKEVADKLWTQAAEACRGGHDLRPLRFAKATANSKGIAGMLALARSEPVVPVLPAELDTDPWLLNCTNGTVDLRTGELRKHDRGDKITKLCPVEFKPDAECPLWRAFLARIFAERDELVRYVQRIAGYCLTGDVREQVLVILHGVGANGKSTLVGTLLELLGVDYAMKAAPDLLLAKGDAHPTERADLHGKRFVVSIETDDGRRMAEALVKDLTGGDRIRARRMREDHWEFSPTHKLLLATNHKPEIRGTDHAMWRRLRLVPFDVVIPDEEQDRTLPAKLRDELPGILAWAVAGCLEWQRDGLGNPEPVQAATAAYRDEQDVLGTWVVERCTLGLNCRGKRSELYASYVAWCEGNGHRPANDTRFGMAMTARRFERYLNNGTWYRGIGLRHHVSDETL